MVETVEARLPLLISVPKPDQQLVAALKFLKPVKMLPPKVKAKLPPKQKPLHRLKEKVKLPLLLKAKLLPKQKLQLKKNSLQRLSA